MLGGILSPFMFFCPSWFNNPRPGWGLNCSGYALVSESSGAHFVLILHWNLKRESRVVDRMGFEPTTFAENYSLTQCECVIQTKLDDRSNKITQLRVFLSLDSGYFVITNAFSTKFLKTLTCLYRNLTR